MTRLGGSMLIVGFWISALGLLMQAVPAAATSESYRYADDFSSEGYTGNSGHDDFVGPWVEFHDWGGAARGIIEVKSATGCASGPCIQFAASDIRLFGTGVGRWARLSEVTSASLRYDFTVIGNSESSGELRTAVFDGRRWNVLAIHHLAQDAEGSASFDVTSFAGKHFAVGFFGHGDWDGEVAIDNVVIDGSRVAATPTSTTTIASTTTQPPATTTTINPIPTTTTVPPSSATTTVVVAATTTTPPTVPPSTPSSTTTSRPPSTTRPPGSTSTTSTTLNPVVVTTTPPATTTSEPVVAPVPPPAPLPAATVQTPTAGLDQNPRYTGKEHLALDLATELVTMPERPEIATTPRPVTGITATITTTAVTLRSHVVPTAGLSLVLAGAAVWGLGRRESIFLPDPE